MMKNLEQTKREDDEKYEMFSQIKRGGIFKGIILLCFLASIIDIIRHLLSQTSKPSSAIIVNICYISILIGSIFIWKKFTFSQQRYNQLIFFHALMIIAFFTFIHLIEQDSFDSLNKKSDMRILQDISTLRAIDQKDIKDIYENIQIFSINSTLLTENIENTFIETNSNSTNILIEIYQQKLKLQIYIQQKSGRKILIIDQYSNLGEREKANLNVSEIINNYQDQLDTLKKYQYPQIRRKYNEIELNFDSEQNNRTYQSLNNRNLDAIQENVVLNVWGGWYMIMSLMLNVILNSQDSMFYFILSTACQLIVGMIYYGSCWMTNINILFVSLAYLYNKNIINIYQCSLLSHSRSLIPQLCLWRELINENPDQSVLLIEENKRCFLDQMNTLQNQDIQLSFPFKNMSFEKMVFLNHPRGDILSILQNMYLFNRQISQDRNTQKDQQSGFVKYNSLGRRSLKTPYETVRNYSDELQHIISPIQRDLVAQEHITSTEFQQDTIGNIIPDNVANLISDTSRNQNIIERKMSQYLPTSKRESLLQEQICFTESPQHDKDIEQGQQRLQPKNKKKSVQCKIQIPHENQQCEMNQFPLSNSKRNSSQFTKFKKGEDQIILLNLIKQYLTSSSNLNEIKVLGAFPYNQKLEYAITLGKCEYENKRCVYLAMKESPIIPDDDEKEKVKQFMRKIISSLAHELKTPLNSVLSQIDQMHIFCESKCQQDFSILKSNANLLHYKVEDFLNYSMYLQGETDLNLETFSLQEVIDQLIEIFKSQADIKSLYFHTNTSFVEDKLKANDQSCLSNTIININESIPQSNQISSFLPLNRKSVLLLKSQTLIKGPIQTNQSFQKTNLNFQKFKKELTFENKIPPDTSNCQVQIDQSRLQLNPNLNGIQNDSLLSQQNKIELLQLNSDQLFKENTEYLKHFDDQQQKVFPQSEKLITSGEKDTQCFELSEADMLVKNDKKKLTCILINLLSNALKFTFNGGITLQVLRLNKNYVQFTVSDTGIGIEERLLNKLNNTTLEEYDNIFINPDLDSDDSQDDYQDILNEEGKEDKLQDLRTQQILNEQIQPSSLKYISGSEKDMIKEDSQLLRDPITFLKKKNSQNSSDQNKKRSSNEFYFNSIQDKRHSSLLREVKQKISQTLECNNQSFAQKNPLLFEQEDQLNLDLKNHSSLEQNNIFNNGKIKRIASQVSLSHFQNNCGIGIKLAKIMGLQLSEGLSGLQIQSQKNAGSSFSFIIKDFLGNEHNKDKKVEAVINKTSHFKQVFGKSGLFDTDKNDFPNKNISFEINQQVNDLKGSQNVQYQKNMLSTSNQNIDKGLQLDDNKIVESNAESDSQRQEELKLKRLSTMPDVSLNNDDNIDEEYSTNMAEKSRRDDQKSQQFKQNKVRSMSCRNSKQNIDYLANKNQLNSNQMKLQTLLQNKRLLIVDDMPFNIKILRNYLQFIQNIVVKEAFNGVEALNIVQKESFDLILMDINMPIMDGIEATIKINELINHNIITPVPIIIISAFSTQNDIITSENAGASAHISKPVTYPNLINAIQIALN